MRRKLASSLSRIQAVGSPASSARGSGIGSFFLSLNGMMLYYLILCWLWCSLGVVTILLWWEKIYLHNWTNHHQSPSHQNHRAGISKKFPPTTPTATRHNATCKKNRRRTYVVSRVTREPGLCMSREEGEALLGKRLHAYGQSVLTPVLCCVVTRCCWNMYCSYV